MSTTVYFKYGSMNSGKSLELIKVAYNYRENEIEPLVLKPDIDSRSIGNIYSRTGLLLPAQDIDVADTAAVKSILEANKETNVILIEEANFLSAEIIDTIIDFAFDNDISSVMFFGLKVDFRGELFEGSKRIIERADKLEEATSICWCGKKARQNARVVNGKITKDGPTILVDDDKTKVEYVTLCNYHYYKEELKD